MASKLRSRLDRIPRTQLWHDVASAWRVPPAERAVDWIPQHLKIPQTKETPGRWDLDKLPYFRFPLEKVDDPNVRAMFLRIAARGGKTTFAISVLIYRTKTKHLPALFVSSDEARADDTIETDIYPMLEACALTRHDLLPERKRKRERGVQLGADRIRRGFAGSPSSLAGFPAATIIGNEVSKWGQISAGRGKNESKSEAHPIYLARQRGKLFPWDSLFVAEGTPARKGDCVISSLVEAPSTQRWYYHVPCPHCGTYQRLQWSEDYGPYKKAGVKWEKGADGHTDALLAERTAYYECVGGCRIENADRPAMMRGGVWVAEGQTIVADASRIGGETPPPRITGEPLVDSSDIAFDELSTLYSLLISGWGQLAGEWARALGDPERLRDFINSTLARQWDPKPQALDPHVVAKRICVEKLPPLIIPSWAKFLTGGVDVQQDATVFPFVFSAWGPGGRGHKVAHGIADGFAGIRAQLQRSFRFDGSEDKTRPLLTLIDSGYERDQVYNFCAECIALGIDARPSKGSSGDVKELDYDESEIEDWPGLKLVRVDTYTTNTWLQRILNGMIKPTDPLFYSLTEADQLDLALLAQLCNGQYLERRTDMGRLTKGWDKINVGLPDDLRDGARYSRVAAQILTQHGATWNALPTSRICLEAPAPPPAPISQENSDRGFSQRREIRRR